MFSVEAACTHGLLFSKPLSLARILVLALSVVSVATAAIFPFILFLNGVLTFEAARYFGSFMFYAGLTTCLIVGLTTKFKINWQLRKQTTFLTTLLFLTVFVSAIVTTPAVTALTPLPTDKGPNNSSAYKFSIPFTEYQWVAGEFRDHTFYAINGSDWNIMTIVEPWQAVPPWVAFSTNKTALIQQILTVTTPGKILLNELSFPYALTIPTNVTVVESYKGLTREFIPVANSQGSPYTISVDTVNPTYYLAQDSQSRFINSWSSTNGTTLFQNTYTACIAGDMIFVKHGTYNLPNTIIFDNKPFNLVGESLYGTILNFTGTSDAFYITRYSESTMRDFTLLIGSGITNAIHFKGAVGSYNCNYDQIKIQALTITTGQRGIYFESDGVSNYNNHFGTIYIDKLDFPIVSNGTSYANSCNGQVFDFLFILNTGTSPLTLTRYNDYWTIHQLVSENEAGTGLYIDGSHIVIENWFCEKGTNTISPWFTLDTNSAACKLNLVETDVTWMDQGAVDLYDKGTNNWITQLSADHGYLNYVNRTAT